MFKSMNPLDRVTLFSVLLGAGTIIVVLVAVSSPETLLLDGPILAYNLVLVWEARRDAKKEGKNDG